MDWFHILEITGVILGLVYLWYEYHASARLWAVQIAMTCISMWVYYSKGLYADFGINIYYLLMAVYGWILWTVRGRGNNTNSGDSRPVTHMPRRAWAVAVVSLLAIWAVLGWGLISFTDSNVPWYDAFTTALSIVATWMLARKWVEQWLAWLVVDAVCTGLYIYKEIYFYAGLYAVYTIVAWYGYRRWLRLL